MPLKDLANQKFGSLVVQSRSENLKDGTATWNCVCICGNTRIIPGNKLRAGFYRSCGCQSPKFTSERTKKHGKSRSRVYRIWVGMKIRCSDKAMGKSRKNYYEKGIRVCKRWMNFENFYLDMGDPPAGCTLERVNGNKNYGPENCIWASYKMQANNMKSNHVVEHLGESMTISMWANRVGMKPNTLLTRIRRHWTFEVALRLPVQQRRI